MKKLFVVLLAIALVGLFTTSTFAGSTGHWKKMGTHVCQPSIRVHEDSPSLLPGRCDPTDLPPLWQVVTSDPANPACGNPPGFSKRYTYWTCLKDYGAFKGTVVDKDTGDPLAGVAIKNGGVTVATTGSDGKFKVESECSQPGAMCGTPETSGGGAGGVPGTGSILVYKDNYVDASNNDFDTVAEAVDVGNAVGVELGTFQLDTEAGQNYHYPVGGPPNGIAACMPRIKVHSVPPAGEACNATAPPWQIMIAAYPTSACGNPPGFDRYIYWYCQAD